MNTDMTLPLQFDPQKLGIQPPPTRRFAFPATRATTNDQLFVGCMVAMEETGNDGYLLRDGVVKVIAAKDVKVTFEMPTGGQA